MKKLFYCYVLLFLLLHFGCVYTDGISDIHKLKLDFKSNNDDLVFDVLIVNGSHKVDGNGLIDVELLPVHQGKSYLFGIIKWRERNGDDYFRIKMIKDKILIKEFSYNDIIGFDNYFTGDSIATYIIPKID